MKRALLVGMVVLVFVVYARAAPQVSRENGVYLLENSILRAEVKTTELYRLTYKPTGQEVMSPSYHGVVYISSRAEYVPQNKVHYLIQDSFQGNRAYEIEAGQTEATLTVNFDWGWAPEQPGRPYAVKEQITIFADKPYLRVRYYVSVQERPVLVPGGFSVGCRGMRATHGRAGRAVAGREAQRCANVGHAHRFQQLLVRLLGRAFRAFHGLPAAGADQSDSLRLHGGGVLGNRLVGALY